MIFIVEMRVDMSFLRYDGYLETPSRCCPHESEDEDEVEGVDASFVRSVKRLNEESLVYGELLLVL